jgi:hypothetical protein
MHFLDFFILYESYSPIRSGGVGRLAHRVTQAREFSMGPPISAAGIRAGGTVPSWGLPTWPRLTAPETNDEFSAGSPLTLAEIVRGAPN